MKKWKYLTFIVSVAVVLSGFPGTSVKAAINEKSFDIKLTELSVCESGRRADIKVLDSDGYFSYGAYQYHWKTFEKAVKHFGLRDTVVLEDIYNPSLQRTVTRLLLRENPRNVNLWFNCSKKTGLDAWMRNYTTSV